MKTFEPLAGIHIDAACKEAVAIAISGGEDVKFSFNDIELIATPNSDSSKLSASFYKQMEESAEAYRNSPEGKYREEQRNMEIVSKKLDVSELLAELETILVEPIDSLMQWLKRFTPLADDVSVKIDCKAIADSMERAGYIDSQYVGNPPEWFCSKNRMGCYIAGQVINCLRNGMPPHTITVSFIDKYEKLP